MKVTYIKQGEARPICSTYEVQEVEQPTNELILTRKVKVQDYRKTGQPRILLMRKELFKCGFDYGVGIKFNKFTNGLTLRPRKEIKLNGTTQRQDSKQHVFKCQNKGEEYPMIDIRHNWLSDFTVGTKATVKYYQDKIVILKEV